MKRSSQPSSPPEGRVALAIEEQTAKVPSDSFLWAAGAAAIMSWALRATDHKSASEFVARWVPSILICGVYNKIVKAHNEDMAGVGHQRASVLELGKRKKNEEKDGEE